MTIGQLELNVGEKGVVSARGSFRTLMVGLTIRLDPAANQQSEQAPTHDVYALVPGGEMIRVGAAWLKIQKRGELKGERMFTMSIDDPSFPSTLHLSAFPRSKNAKTLDIVWQRSRVQASAPVTAGSPLADGQDTAEARP